MQYCYHVLHLVMQLSMVWNNKPIAIAPMMGWSTPAMQKVMRLLAPNMDFYAQMYHVEALIRRPELLDGYALDRFVLQLGGSSPERYAQLAPILKKKGIDRININVGCPSQKVQHGYFGACLMRTPKLVAECLNALGTTYAPTQLSIKCRLGVDHEDDLPFIRHFMETIITNSGIMTFIIHARKAWLNGLSPKQNRDIPPLNYPRVYALKSYYPDCFIMLNGGVKTVDQVLTHLNSCDGVMLGRLACDDAYQLHLIDAYINGYSAKTRFTLIESLDDYDYSMNLHLQSLYKGVKDSRRWRRELAQVEDKSDLLELAHQCSQ